MAYPEAGAALQPLRKARLTSSHIVRWLAAQQNWDKIHYDQEYCQNVANLPRPIINGALKQHFIVQFLARAFDYRGWVWRVDYQFVGADQIGSVLEVRGRVSQVRISDAWAVVLVDLEMWNLEGAEVTTRGSAVVILRTDGTPVETAPQAALAADLRLSREVAAVDPGVPATISTRLGQILESRESFCPVDLSRLRLFADAIMDLPSVFFDPTSTGAYGDVVGPPLFPLHALEARPGSLKLDEAGEAMGREGTSEIGRDVSSIFGVPAGGLLNGGNKVEIHSLVRRGERVCGKSMLVAARARVGKKGGQMLIFETLNEYWESGGRRLLTERQTIINRLRGS